MEPNQNSQSYLVPLAIIIGFGLIAVAVYFAGSKQPDSQSSTVGVAPENITAGSPRPVTSADYIRGNPNAPILIIEYSDYECPFCKEYHNTLKRIIDEYGVSGRVAWVYRQFPISQLHPNAPLISEAALCVGDIGGNQSFWRFTDLVFEEREFTEPVNIVRLPNYAERVGVSEAEYRACMNGRKMEGAVRESVADALSIGAQGTPHTVLIVGNQQAVINGAQPYETVRGIIENLLSQLDGRAPADTQ